MGSFREQRPTERFEKRKIPRFPVQLPAELGHQKEDLSSICTNLSSEGVSVETSLVMAVGERVAIRVVIAPGEEPLRMLGQVVWRRDMGAVDPESRPINEIGIRFLRPLPTPWKTPVEPEISIEPEEEVPDLFPF